MTESHGATAAFVSIPCGKTFWNFGLHRTDWVLLLAEPMSNMIGLLHWKLTRPFASSLVKNLTMLTRSVKQVCSFPFHSILKMEAICYSALWESFYITLQVLMFYCYINKKYCLYPKYSKYGVFTLMILSKFKGCFCIAWVYMKRSSRCLK